MALYQKLQQNDAKTVYASVESYEEFFNNTKINKEDVSFAKIGPEWPKRIENQLREFLRNWVNVFASRVLFSGPCKPHLQTQETNPSHVQPDYYKNLFTLPWRAGQDSSQKVCFCDTPS